MDARAPGDAGEIDIPFRNEPLAGRRTQGSPALRWGNPGLWETSPSGMFSFGGVVRGGKMMGYDGYPIQGCFRVGECARRTDG